MKEEIGKETFIDEGRSVIDFISQSPSAFHAVDNVAKTLISNDYQELRMGDEWALEPGGRYFVRYNASAIVAFNIPDNGAEDIAKFGYRMIASHSDSPTFRIKPSESYWCYGQKLRTETYGGAILYSWLDRPLGLAGRVVLRSGDPLHPSARLFDFERAVGVIPSVAIHFNRAVNEGASFNKQVDMQILASASASAVDLKSAIAQEMDIAPDEILDYDLYAYDTTPGCLAGFDESLIVCPKQDNLTMAYESVMALIDAAESDTAKMVMVMDNEEVGSGTKQGADSPIVADILRRICSKLGMVEEGFQRAVYNSFLVSADMAHAIHPNHPELSDTSCAPQLNMGPVIKYNAAQKYMTDADGASVFSEICRRAGVPCQVFANRSDMAGGSTLGNIMTSHLALRGVDVGNPMLGMHSSRETGGTKDAYYLRLALSEFLGGM